MIPNAAVRQAERAVKRAVAGYRVCLIASALAAVAVLLALANLVWGGS